MKKKFLFILCNVALLLITNVSNAQFFRISAFNQDGFVMGDIAKKQINSTTAGYVDFNSTSGIEVNYYLNNVLGLGVRWTGNYCGRDVGSYENDLKEKLMIIDDQYDMNQSYAFWTMGSDLGVSYLFDISDKVQLEPYFYFGFKVLNSPMSSVLYNQNNTTFQYQSKPQLFFGYSYSPGVKFHWNAFKHFGLFLSLEYDGNDFFENEERSILYSANALTITDVEKHYKLNSLNIGLGLAFRFGKGLNE